MKHRAVKRRTVVMGVGAAAGVVAAGGFQGHGANTDAADFITWIARDAEPASLSLRGPGVAVL
ncbi:hypothetical protein [Streptomyces avermitilis]|uniref:hypothetical protein n=1 Tax=Streptomyces avermitilis TaxID=33903 RepID=UPI0036A216FE